MTSSRLHWWVYASAILLAAYAVVSVAVRPGYSLAIFGNLVQTGLLLLLFLLNLLNATRTRGNTRYFWASMTIAAGLWLAAQSLWNWYEVVVQRSVPTPFLGDVLFFIHVVPMMGALAVRPHRPASGRLLDFGNLDFTVLLLWWIYLYGFMVIPWQYVQQDVAQYSFGFDLLYLIENTILVVVLATLCMRVRGPWRRIYAPFLVSASVYAVASQVVNNAIARDRYYTGSAYDLWLIAAMLLFVWTALVAQRVSPQTQREPIPRLQAVLVSRLAMAAVISIPVLAAWGMLAGDVPHPVVRFRSFLTLGAMVVLPFFVFLKQYLLDRELVRLLGVSQHNYDNLKRLQVQLVQAEKLAALTQFVAGAGHQINNPLTAVIGYSDLLEQDWPVHDERRHWVVKIGQQARRTQELVKQLLTFAKQAPAEKSMVDLNPLLENAIELRELDLNDDNIRIVKRLEPHMPRLWADGNQLLQVCFHIIGNAIDAMKQSGGGVLTASTRVDEGVGIIEFSDTGPGVKDPQRIFDPFYTTKPIGKGSGLGLSACYGIVSEHGGTIMCENGAQGGATFTLRFPIGGSGNASKAQEALGGKSWQGPKSFPRP